MKRLLFCFISLALIATLSACESNDNSPSDTIPSNTITVDQLQVNPFAFGSGELTIVGIVSSDDDFDFSLLSDDGGFSIPVAYRGSQALPAMGAKIQITGRIIDNCCGDGSLIHSTHYEVIDQ